MTTRRGPRRGKPALDQVLAGTYATREWIEDALKALPRRMSAPSLVWLSVLSSSCRRLRPIWLRSAMTADPFIESERVQVMQVLDLLLDVAYHDGDDRDLAVAAEAYTLAGYHDGAIMVSHSGAHDDLMKRVAIARFRRHGAVSACRGWSSSYPALQAGPRPFEVARIEGRAASFRAESNVKRNAVIRSG